jgi:hypothetical protein
VRRVLVTKPEDKSSLQNLSVDRDKIKMDLKEQEWEVAGIYLATIGTYVGECKRE